MDETYITRIASITRIEGHMQQITEHKKVEH